MHLLAILSALSFQAPPEPTVTVLDNGLTVITQELHYAPVVASAVAYRVGSRNESDGIRGISHFVEHMMFKGTPTMPKARFWQIVQRDGGWANGWTSNDMTVYFLVLPSSRIGDALQIESDRMANTLFDSAEAVSERNVIAEERRMGSTDDPDGALYEALSQAAFTVHPYRHPVVGYDGDILNFSRESGLEYYRRFYSPANAVLSVVGDFDTQELLQMIEARFGSIPAGAQAPGLSEIEPPQVSRRIVEIRHSSNLSRFAMAFHTPAGNDPDTPLVGMLCTMLSGGRASRLEASLVQSGLASDAYAWNEAGMDPGLLVVGASLMPGVEPDSIEKVIRAELDALCTEPLTDVEMQSLRDRARAGMIIQNSSPLGLCLEYVSSQAAYGDPLLSSRQLEIVEAATSDDLMRVAARYFAEGTETIAVLTPTGELGFGGTRERQSLPVDMEEPTAIDYTGLEIPDEMLAAPSTSVSDGVQIRQLSNGLMVMVREDHTFPLASISFAIPMGTLMTDPSLAGIEEITASAMMHGTVEYPYALFHDRLESKGSSLRFRAGAENSSGSVTVLAEDTNLALEVIADLLLRPAFRQDDFETVRGEALAGVAQSGESVFSLGGENLGRLILRDPMQARVQTEETLNSITLQHVSDFWEACCRPQGSIIVVVGDVDSEAVIAEVEGLFGSWENPDAPLPAVDVMVYSDLPGDTLVEPMQGRAQAGVFIGTPGPGYLSDDYIAFRTMNGILGSGIGSRLGHFVRDDQGLAYAVGSYLMASRNQGVFTSYLATRADYAIQAIESVISECERIAAEDVDPVELRLEQASAAAGHALSFMSYSDQSAELREFYMQGQPPDWDRVSVVETLELTAEDIREVAERYLGAGRWFVSVAGGLDENLRPLLEGGGM
jgi:zinc protease